ncbi:Uncharacterised protein [Legionella busanensis]|uniref:Uncharacterized protein n=1 Tax=Legionella busanensis TaxID=190655 RepID=A0A378JWM4_9GAMM|nr:hypothetical protein [Legionella busanensis]STX52622.1 Uncharacterised protein [Legionella busanensis]
MVQESKGLNRDIFRYKCWFITSVLLLGYAYIHVKLTGLYYQIPLESWLDFTVPLPFAQRQLVPFIARLISSVISLQAHEIFFLLELLFVILTFFALQKLLQLEFNNKLALLLSWLFFLLLPLCTIINYRFTLQGGAAAIFYPYDTPSLFFIILGLYLCLKKNWFWLIVCVFFATLNRESSILIVLLIPALYLRSCKDISKLLVPFFSCLGAYILARLWLYYLVLNLSGLYTYWYRYDTSVTNFSVNMQWLFADQNIFMFIFAFAGLPLFWFTFYDYIPLKYRRIRYITFFYFLGLLGVGLVAETRIFAEIIVLIYLPICIAISNWLQNNYIVEPQQQGFWYYLNRYIIFLLIILVLLSNKLIDSVIKQMILVPNWKSFQVKPANLSLIKGT